MLKTSLGYLIRSDPLLTPCQCCDLRIYGCPTEAERAQRWLSARPGLPYRYRFRAQIIFAGARSRPVGDCEAGVQQHQQRDITMSEQVATEAPAVPVTDAVKGMRKNGMFLERAFADCGADRT